MTGANIFGLAVVAAALGVIFLGSSAVLYVKQLRRDRLIVDQALRQLALVVATSGRWVDPCTDLLIEARVASAPLSYWRDV